MPIKSDAPKVGDRTAIINFIPSPLASLTTIPTSPTAPTHPTHPHNNTQSLLPCQFKWLNCKSALLRPCASLPECTLRADLGCKQP